MAAAASKPAQSPEPVLRKSKAGLVIGLIVVGVVAAQIGMTYWLMREPVSTAEESGHHPEVHHAATHDGSEHESGEDESTEIALGEFSFSNTAAIPGIIMHVDFKLTALALPSQSSILEAQIKRSRERVREAINKVVRSANYDELIDPNLGTLKRMMRDELNRMLDKSLIGEVVINDIRILQQ